MTTRNRRDFLRALATTAAATAGATASVSLLPDSIRKALAISPKRVTGTLDDVEHVVILMQENRSFDHYFGTLRGVRGFADKLPIPVPDRPGVEGKSVWFQANGPSDATFDVVTPFRLNTEQTFALMRVDGTPHTWPDAQGAWDGGRLHEWPRYKTDHALGYYTRADIPFQFALAEAFTISDAYHCSFHGGTNPNRVFAWTGHNDALQRAGGPVLNNAYDNLEHDPEGGYRFRTYCERLQDAGISWQVYQNMDDNFTDNPLAGFASFRAAVRGLPGSDPALAQRGLSTRDLDLLARDVRDGTLPQVSWIIATADGSEHPGPSSPAQGADYTARVLDALTGDPEVWSKTVLFLMFDENDGFFDHVPPPAVPSYVRYDPDPARAELAGASTVETRGEYHELLPLGQPADEAAPLHRPYGLGPRVPLYVISPWSKGGWVHSQVSDHTSVIRFLERRFGVEEPNISRWRRAVCSDLTGAFDFAGEREGTRDTALPETAVQAERARSLIERTIPETPLGAPLPQQEVGTRPSRALPYQLSVVARVEPARASLTLTFDNQGAAGAVFHVYDRRALDQLPRRYTVEAHKQLAGSWTLDLSEPRYDLWVLGPNGFHRHFVGRVDGPSAPELHAGYDVRAGNLYVVLQNPGAREVTLALEDAYRQRSRTHVTIAPYAQHVRYFWLRGSGHWYDLTVHQIDDPSWSRRLAGRVETGRDSISDPALGGRAFGEHARAR